jgi:hypothetical protein
LDTPKKLSPLSPSLCWIPALSVDDPNQRDGVVSRVAITGAKIHKKAIDMDSYRVEKKVRR